MLSPLYLFEFSDGLVVLLLQHLLSSLTPHHNPTLLTTPFLIQEVAQLVHPPLDGVDGSGELHSFFMLLVE